MKVTQVAPALASVFVVDLAGQVYSITRSPDGLWGRWQPAGIAATHVVHAGSVVATIGADRRVSALERRGGAEWVTWDRPAVEIRATHLQGRGPVLFANDGKAVWQTSKPSPNAEWSAWVPLPGPVAALETALLPGGQPALFAILGNEVVYRWNESDQEGWTEWQTLGDPGRVVALQAGTLGSGGLVVFALGQDGRVWHRWQDEPHAAWSHWFDLGGPVRSISLTRSPRGGLAVFAVASDASVRFRFQPKAFAEWSPWLDLGGHASSVAAQLSYTDGLEVFAVGEDGAVSHKWCERLDWPWTDWTALDYETSPLRGRQAVMAPAPVARNSSSPSAG